MKKDNLDLNQIYVLHQTGELDQAESGYLHFLRKNPRHVEVLHSLSILYAQKENFTDAIHYLKIALQYQPQNSTLQLHLANILKAQGLFQQAAEILEKTIQENPNYVPALNNLGTVYYAQAKLADAIRMYQSAIQKEPDFIDAYYNLGLALIKHNQLEEAIKIYQTLLQKTPEHFAARFHLACALMKKEKMKEAIAEFLIIEKSQPYHFETQSNMATCYLKTGELNEAKLHYNNALKLTPNDLQILFNLGVINTQLGDTDQAIQHYQTLLTTDPDHFAAHNNLAVAFLAKQHIPFALQHFKEAARLQPENQSIQYTIKALAQNHRLLAAPTDYIKSLFNAYADHYDEHLLTALEYQLPKHLLQAVTKVKQPATWDILDLGCGTGLCGALLKPFAKNLIGVDLSEKMLETAHQKNIYDELICDELTSFLLSKHAAYDLILAGDVLVYIGDLASIFQYIARALRPKGLFVFNTEISQQDDYKMNQSGRFSHHKKYLETLAKKNHLNIAYDETVITRMQNNKPVYGHLLVLQLP